MENSGKKAILVGGLLVVGVLILKWGKVMRVFGKRFEGYWLTNDSERVYFSDSSGVIYFKNKADYLAHRVKEGLPMDFKLITELNVRDGEPNDFRLSSDTPIAYVNPTSGGAE